MVLLRFSNVYLGRRSYSIVWSTFDYCLNVVNVEVNRQSTPCPIWNSIWSSMWHICSLKIPDSLPPVSVGRSVGLSVPHASRRRRFLRIHVGGGAAAVHFLVTCMETIGRQMSPTTFYEKYSFLSCRGRSVAQRANPPPRHIRIFGCFM